jgi:transposase-like protein
MKRHSSDEIELKLRQAGDLLASGQSQAQICKSLGISVMTFHRWRKQQEQLTGTKPLASSVYSDHRSSEVDKNDQPSLNLPASSRDASIQELIEENRRLKKIVTDLLLEKIKLEEAEALNKPGVRLTREPQPRTLPRTR